MIYKGLILPMIIALGATNDSVAKLSAATFPKSSADITFLQRIKLNTDGYEPYRDSVIYQPLNISAPTPKPTNTQNNNIQGTVATTTYNPQPPNAPVNNNNNNTTSGGGNTQNTTSEIEIPVISPQTGNNESGTGAGTQNTPPPPPVATRRPCFTQSTGGATRYVPPRVNNARAYWWIGDSRFTGMYINGVIGRPDNEAVVAHAGRGHEWLTNTPSPTGISLLETCLRDGDVVILNLGANDIWKYDAYISTYHNLMSKYPNVIFKVVSVNPVCDSKARLKNAKIKTFNTHMKNAFSGNFIDTYSVVKPLVTESTTDSEGLHYRGGGIEQKIYDTIKQSVGGN